jgi:hypothetical protein
MTQTCGNCRWPKWEAEGEPKIGRCGRPLPPLPRPVKVKQGCIFSTDAKCKCWEVINE